MVYLSRPRPCTSECLCLSMSSGKFRKRDGSQATDRAISPCQGSPRPVAASTVPGSDTMVSIQNLHRYESLSHHQLQGYPDRTMRADRYEACRVWTSGFGVAASRETQCTSEAQFANC